MMKCSHRIPVTSRPAAIATRVRRKCEPKRPAISEINRTPTENGVLVRPDSIGEKPKPTCSMIEITMKKPGMPEAKIVVTPAPSRKLRLVMRL